MRCVTGTRKLLVKARSLDRSFAFLLDTDTTLGRLVDLPNAIRTQIAMRAFVSGGAITGVEVWDEIDMIYLHEDW